MRTETLLLPTGHIDLRPASREILVPAPTMRLQLDAAQQRALIDNARNPSAVDGLTHRHYHYPARFSPLLIGQAIETFTDPGDLVIAPYVGGGTTTTGHFTFRAKANAAAS